MSSHQSVTGTLTTRGQASNAFYLRPGEVVAVTLTITGTATISLSELLGVPSSPQAYRPRVQWSSNQTATQWRNDGTEPVWLALVATAISGSVAYTLADVAGDQILQEWRAADGTLVFRITDEGPADLPLNVTAFGAVADGVTDNTALLVSLFEGLDENARGVYLAPYGVRFDVTTVLASMPPGIVLIDETTVNDFRSAGETTKVIGILANDAATSDSAMQVASGHHAVLLMNNYDTAGTASGDIRLASTVWAAGQLTDRGFRGVGMQSWRKNSTGDYWEYAIRQLAPWVAADAQYERWAAGVAATSGVTYVQSGSSIYVAASTGTTGGTAPSWGSGTDTDGGVDWTWVASRDATIYTVDEYGRVRLNSGGAATDLFAARQNIRDAATVAQAVFEGRGVSKTVRLLLKPTDAAEALTTVPYLEATATGGLRVRKSDGSANICDFTDSGGIRVNEFRTVSGTAADGDTTPTVANVSTLFLSNTGATSITTLDDASDLQMVTLVATNANTTLVHSAGFTLTGSVDFPMTAYSSITMQRLPASVSSRWIEIARSAK